MRQEGRASQQQAAHVRGGSSEGEEQCGWDRTHEADAGRRRTPLALAFQGFDLSQVQQEDTKVLSVETIRSCLCHARDPGWQCAEQTGEGPELTLAGQLGWCEQCGC